MIVSPRLRRTSGLPCTSCQRTRRFGALSVDEGKVKVVWSCADDDAGEPQFRMQWIEAGGPEVIPPAHKGFGQMVLEQLVARALQGEAQFRFQPSGVSWALNTLRRHIIYEPSNR